MERGKGQPTKLTKELAERIFANIARRVPKVLAAEAQGITERTFYNWVQWGKEDCDNGVASAYADFFQRLREVEQDLIVSHTDRIASGQLGWQSGAWLLERLAWKHFGNNTAIIELESRITKMEQENGSNKE